MEAALLLLGFLPEGVQYPHAKRIFSHTGHRPGWVQFYQDVAQFAAPDVMRVSSSMQDKLDTPYAAGAGNLITFDQFIERWINYVEALDGQ